MPISYPVSKVVMEHLEANRRYALAARCSSLRALHELVPLTINYMKLNENSFILNDCNHQFRAFMEHPGGLELPPDLKTLNHHGASFDLNQYGSKDLDEGLEQADVKFPMPKVRPARIIGLKPQAAGLTTSSGFEPNSESDTEQDQAESSSPPAKKPTIETRLADLKKKKPANFYTFSRSKLRQKRHQERRSSEVHQAPQQAKHAQEYFPYIRFHMQYLLNPVHFSLAKTVRFEPGIKMRDAIRHHLGNIFTANTFVRHLEVDLFRGILRIPDSLGKFRIQNLTATPQALEAIQPLIEPVSLRCLTMEISTHWANLLRNELLRAFPSLQLTQDTYPDGAPDSWVLALNSLPDMEVYIKDFIIAMPDIGRMARNWVEKQRRVGTKLSMELAQESDAIWIRGRLDVIKQDIGAEFKRLPERVPGRFRTYISLSINASSNLIIYGHRIPAYQAAWMLVMEVVAVEE